MSIKNKLTIGTLSLMLGIALIVGGTWAAFNDIETVEAGVAAGHLEMDLAEVNGDPYTFDVSNLKPGDTMERDIEFQNAGTLAIMDILMAIESVDFTAYVPGSGDAGYGDTWAPDANTSALDFLDQFEVSVITLGTEGGGVYPKQLLLNPVSLKDFYLASDSVYGTANKFANGAVQADINQAQANVASAIAFPSHIVGNRINVGTTGNQGWEGVPVDPTDEDSLRIKIEFIDNTTDTYPDGTYIQNIFQGDSADIKVSFEARQWPGQEYEGDGYIYENERTDTNRDGTNY